MFETTFLTIENEKLKEENRILCEKLKLFTVYKDGYEKLLKLLSSKYSDITEEKVASQLSEYIEKLAAAYIKESNISPLEAVLHTAINDNTKEIVYWIDKDRNKFTSVQQTGVFNV